MRNYKGLGGSMVVIAAWDVLAGQGVSVGPAFGVAANDAARGSTLQLMTSGVYNLPAHSSFTAGDPVFWSGVACVRSGVQLIGYAAAASSAGWVDVNLTGLESTPRRVVAPIVQDYAATSNASITSTMSLCRQAPAHYDAVRVILRGVVSGANTFKASVAPSAQFNNGWQPKDAANADQAFTAVTWGTTAKDNPRNPGGGAATATVTGTSGANATHDLIEGDVASDIVYVRSLDRTDFPDKAPLIFLRLFGVNIPAVSVAESADNAVNPWSAKVPDFYSGYWSTTDYTSATPPGAPTQTWLPSVQVQFFLRGKPVSCVAVAGDSIEQGWVAATVVPQFGGNINGWPRRLVEKLNAAGRPAVFCTLAHTGNKSSLFRQRAITQLYRGGVTHLFIKPYSVNEAADSDAQVHADCAQTTAIINLCVAFGVTPIIIQPWGGQDNGTSRRAIADAYISACRASGILVFDARVVTDKPDGSLKDEAKTVNSGGAVVDSTHLNDTYQELVAAYAFSLSGAFGL